MWKLHVYIRVSKDTKRKKNDKKRIPTHLLAYLLTLVVGVDN